MLSRLIYIAGYLLGYIWSKIVEVKDEDLLPASKSLALEQLLDKSRHEVTEK